METDHQQHAAHNKHIGHSPQIFFKKFRLSLILTVPVVFYSNILETLFNFKAPIFFGSQYIPLIFGSIVFFYGGWIFIVGAFKELKSRLPGMMTLISIAISAAYLWSIYAAFAGAEALFWELTTLITIMLLGHWLEMRAVSGAAGALKELSKLLPDTAEIQLTTDNKQLTTKIISLSELRENDIVLVKPGGKIPSDGKVIDGESDVNESIITGESKPVFKKEGDSVIAGTINRSEEHTSELQSQSNLVCRPL